MIRVAEFKDTGEILDYLKDHVSAIDVDAQDMERYNPHWMMQLLGESVKANLCWVYEKDEKIVGMFMAMYTPMMWSDRYFEVRLLMIHSDNKIAAGKLIKKFDERATMILEQQENVRGIAVASRDPQIHRLWEKLGYPQQEVIHYRRR